MEAVRKERRFGRRLTSEGLTDVRLNWTQEPDPRKTDIWNTTLGEKSYNLRIFYTFHGGEFKFDVILTSDSEQQIRNGLSLSHIRSDDDWIRAGLLWAEDLILSPMQRLAIDVTSE